jgi:hypothetical protein
MGWFNLGKRRSHFGEWLDSNDIQQIDLEQKAKLSRGTISKLCNDDEYTPKQSTIVKIIKALNQMGKNVNKNDFWDM